MVGHFAVFSCQRQDQGSGSEVLFEHKQIRGGINVMAIVDHILGVLFLVLIVDT